MNVRTSLENTAVTKRSLSRKALPSGGGCGLFLLCATMGACGAEYESIQLPKVPHCTVGNVPTHRYAITSFLLPQSTQDHAEDMDGDGKTDNQLGEYLAYGGIKGAFPSLPFGTVEELINRQLGERGRGVLLLDVRAEEQGGGCAEIIVRTATAPAADRPARVKGTPFVVATGSQHVTLQAAGSQDQLRTLPYDRMSAGDAKTLEVYMPLETTAHRFRLHGARIELTQDGNGVHGDLRGVIKRSELDEAIWPIWAREFTELIHQKSDWLALDSDKAPEELKNIKERIQNLEQATGKQKCMDNPNACCTTSPKTCHILPSQLQQYYRNSIVEDLDAFAQDGSWTLTARSAPKDRDSLSIAIGFTAERTEIVEGCRAGSFCTIAIDSSLGDNILGGHANRSSDLWLTLQGGRALHHDGLAFWKQPDNLELSGNRGYTYTGSIWGASSDEVWTAFSEHDGPGSQGRLAFRRWNGGVWTDDKRLPSTDTKTYSVTAMTGAAADDIWALGHNAADDKHQIWHFDGQQWKLLRESDTALSALYSPRKGRVLIAGDRGVVLERVDTMWREFSVGGLNFASLAGNSEQNVWAVSSVDSPAKGDCRRFNGTEWTTPPPGFCEVENRTYTTAWMDASGVLWTGGSNRMLRRYAPQKGDCRFVDIPSDIPSKVMKDGVEQDNPEGIKLLFGDAREGAVWALTDAGRLLRYQP